MVAPETHSLDDCLKNLRAYDDATFAELSRVNTHTYAGTQRRELRELASRRGKRIWQSESGPLGMRRQQPLETYLAMAERIVADLNELRADAWLDWQVIDGPIWGCINVNQKDHAFRKSAKYPFYAIFTQSVRPGDYLVNVDQPHVLAAISEKRRVLTIIVVNSTSETWTYRFALEGVRASADHGRLRRTSETESLVDLRAAPVGDAEVAVSCSARSVNAVLIPVEVGRTATKAQNAARERKAEEAATK